MTRNQIDYWTLQETKRHNQVSEQESVRHNRADEGETQRSHRANEELGRNNLLELSRHNQSVENETNRHNVAMESVEQGKLSETTRHNKATENIGYGQLLLQQGNLEVARGQLVVSQRNVDELVRHNVSQEVLQDKNVSLGYGTLAETSRHNFAVEGNESRKNDISAWNARNATQANILRGKELQETKRNNLANNVLKLMSNMTDQSKVAVDVTKGFGKALIGLAK